MGPGREPGSGVLPASGLCRRAEMRQTIPRGVSTMFAAAVCVSPLRPRGSEPGQGSIVCRYLPA